MAHNRKLSSGAPLQETPAQAGGAAGRLPEVESLLAAVGTLLHQGQVEKALDAVACSGVKSPWASCALGVCQLRLGNPNRAVDVFRSLVLASGGLLLRKDVPDVFKTNYATALLLSGNLSGGQQVLHELSDQSHPTAVKLQQAIRRWKDGLTFWQKLDWWMGGKPNHPFAIDFLPGDLE